MFRYVLIGIWLTLTSPPAPLMTSLELKD